MSMNEILSYKGNEIENFKSQNDQKNFLWGFMSLII